MADSCKHDRLLTFKDAMTQEPVGLWACATCRAKFMPLDLAVEKDAKRYRKWRDAYAGMAEDPESALMMALADAWEPEAVDRLIDAAMAADASGAA